MPFRLKNLPFRIKNLPFPFKRTRLSETKTCLCKVWILKKFRFVEQTHKSNRICKTSAKQELHLLLSLSCFVHYAFSKVGYIFSAFDDIRFVAKFIVIRTEKYTLPFLPFKNQIGSFFRDKAKYFHETRLSK